MNPLTVRRTTPNQPRTPSREGRSGASPDASPGGFPSSVVAFVFPSLRHHFATRLLYPGTTDRFVIAA
jgi:hypothetical protein